MDAHCTWAVPGRRWLLVGLAAGLGSAAVFALFHVVPLVMIVAFVLGVVNALLVERSGSIWPAVVAHATLNTSGLVAAAFLL